MLQQWLLMTLLTHSLYFAVVAYKLACKRQPIWLLIGYYLLVSLPGFSVGFHYSYACGHQLAS